MTGLTQVASASNAQQVNRSLRRLFFVLWFLVAFHGVILRRHELWPHGALVIGVGVVPPVLPIVVTLWGKAGVAVVSWVVTALAACGWVAAARHPNDGFVLLLARAALCVYWLTLSFLIALGT
jgi:hypothetical protein